MPGVASLLTGLFRFVVQEEEVRVLQLTTGNLMVADNLSWLEMMEAEFP